MNITTHSHNRFYKTFDEWKVDREFADPIFNYLVHGFNPGSFFTSVLANDCLGAFQRSHPGNTMKALKNLAGWIRNYVPAQAYGSYEAVEKWTADTTETQRRAVLEAKNLLYSEQDEIMLTLTTTPTTEPILW